MLNSKRTVIEFLQENTHAYPGATTQEIAQGVEYSISTVRERLRELRDDGHVYSTKRSCREHQGWQQETTVTRKHHRLAPHYEPDLS